ncbi:hypothetical protein AB0L14_37895 [Streptomyces sp. NPDC052727]|uniref:hypothetical protein n=1 Tax=Streptomyces sp. NPDC052727 TaxID=3154854 RepID=UPI00342FB678
MNKEIRRRTDVVASSPTAPPSSGSPGRSWPNSTTSGPNPAGLRGPRLLARARLHPIESETNDTVLPTELTA